MSGLGLRASIQAWLRRVKCQNGTAITVMNAEIDGVSSLGLSSAKHKAKV